MELELNQTEQGVCPIVVVTLGRRGTGKTKLMEAGAPLVCTDRKKLVIVSPLSTLKARMGDIPWYKISVLEKAKIEKLFRKWLDEKDKDGNSVQRFVLADEADELTAANAAGTAGGFVAQSVYDYINYGREQGLGIWLSSRRPSNIAKDICANANLVFVANTTDPGSLDYYAAWMNDPTEPETNFRDICRVLPDYVFMVWSPVGGKKFLGYVKVNPATNEIEPWDPSELKTKEGDVLSASGTDRKDTPGTDGTGSSSDAAPGTGRSAPSAGGGSLTGAAASTAKGT